MRHDVRLFDAITALRRLLTRKSLPPVATLDELADFLAAQTAYVAQRTVLQYCRARTGLNCDELFHEQEFLDGLEVCRWEAYAALLADVAELVLILLRRQSPADPHSYLPGMAEAAGAALRRHPCRVTERAGTRASAAIEQHLARSLIAAPRAVHLVGFGSADAIFGHLPIHPDLRRGDREMFRNSGNSRFAAFSTRSRAASTCPPLRQRCSREPEEGEEPSPTEEHGCGSTSWPDATLPCSVAWRYRTSFVPDAGQRPADPAVPGRIRGSAPSC